MHSQRDRRPAPRSGTASRCPRSNYPDNGALTEKAMVRECIAILVDSILYLPLWTILINLGWLFSILRKNKTCSNPPTSIPWWCHALGELNVPNHQPAYHRDAIHWENCRILQDTQVTNRSYPLPLLIKISYRIKPFHKWECKSSQSIW